MDWYKLSKHAFDNHNPPQYRIVKTGKKGNRKITKIPIEAKTFGEIEREAMVQNVAVCIQHHGLRTTGNDTLDAEARELLAAEQEPDAEMDTRTKKALNRWLAPADFAWVQYGQRFGNYLVIVTNIDGVVRINTLHTSGEPVYWERFLSKGKIWYVQTKGLGNGSKDRILETKCEANQFLTVMVRRCGEQIIKHLQKAIFDL